MQTNSVSHIKTEKIDVVCAVCKKPLKLVEHDSYAECCKKGNKKEKQDG